MFNSWAEYFVESGLEKTDFWPAPIKQAGYFSRMRKARTARTFHRSFAYSALDSSVKIPSGHLMVTQLSKSVEILATKKTYISPYLPANCGVK